MEYTEFLTNIFSLVFFPFQFNFLSIYTMGGFVVIWCFNLIRRLISCDSIN